MKVRKGTRGVLSQKLIRKLEGIDAKLERSNVPDYHDFGAASQEAVMQDYRSTPTFHRVKEAERKLHQFFSPFRVPSGLTDKEVAVCVMLNPLRRRWKPNKSKDPLANIMSSPHPPEFIHARMTRKRFKKGLRTMLFRLASGA